MAQRIVANGIKMNYEIEGPLTAPVVTLSHSLAADLSMWEPQLPALTPRYRVLRYDTRGHGGTDAPEGPYSLELLAEDVVALLAALEIEQTHFVGLSMGGMIAETLALDHPAVLRSLVLCDTASGHGPLTPAAWKAMWKERIDGARSSGLEPNVEGTIERWFSPAFVQEHENVVDQVRDTIRSTPVAGYTGCCHAIAGLDLSDRLHAITTPTLILVGEEDPGTPVAVSQEIHEKIPGSQLRVLPGARHLSNIGNAAEFNAALTGFLAEH